MSQAMPTSSSTISRMPHDQRPSCRIASRDRPRQRPAPRRSRRGSGRPHRRERRRRRGRGRARSRSARSPSLAVEDEPDPEADDGEHRRGQHERADHPQAGDEAGDRVVLAAADHECGEHAEDDEAAEPDHRGEDVQEHEPVVDSAASTIVQAALRASGRCRLHFPPLAPGRGRSRAGTSATATSATATQKVVPNASASAGAAAARACGPSARFPRCRRRGQAARRRSAAGARSRAAPCRSRRRRAGSTLIALDRLRRRPRAARPGTRPPSTGMIVLPSPSADQEQRAAEEHVRTSRRRPACRRAVPSSASTIPAGTTTPRADLVGQPPASGIASAAPSPCGTSSSPVASALSPRTSW